VEQQQQRDVAHLDARQVHAEAVQVLVVPVLGRQLAAMGVEPGEVLDARVVDLLAAEEPSGAQQPVVGAQ
jgi:hypothetical protein